MSYLLQMSDEFRQSYEEIDKKANEIIDKLAVLEIRLQEVEARLNTNRQEDSSSQYNKLWCFHLFVSLQVIKRIHHLWKFGLHMKALRSPFFYANDVSGLQEKKGMMHNDFDDREFTDDERQEMEKFIEELEQVKTSQNKLENSCSKKHKKAL